MQQGTRKRAHQEGSVQPKAGNSSSVWSILKEIRMLRFGFPAASEQSAADSRNSAAGGFQKRQRGWKGSFSQLRFSSVCLELWANFQPYCYSPPEEQHHRRARRRDEALMLCSKLSDLAENQGKERSVKRWSLHGHEKLRASSSAQQDAAEFLPAGRCGWQHISSSARNWDARADWDRIPPRGPLRDQFCSAQHPRGTSTTSILSWDHNTTHKQSTANSGSLQGPRGAACQQPGGAQHQFSKANTEHRVRNQPDGQPGGLCNAAFSPSEPSTSKLQKTHKHYTRSFCSIKLAAFAKSNL